MVNIRINKLALELNIQNDQIMEELQKLEIKVKNHMSAIDQDVANQIRENFSNKKDVKSSKTAVKAKKTSKPKATTKTTTKVATKTQAKKKATPKKIKAAEEITQNKTKKPKATISPVKTAAKKTTTEAIKTTPTKSKVAVAPEPESIPKKIQKKQKPVAEPKPIKKLGLKIIKTEEKHQKEKDKPKTLKSSKKPEKSKPQPAVAKPSSKPAKKGSLPEPAIALAEGFETVQIHNGMSVRDLAETLKSTPNDIIRELIGFGIMATINQNLDLELTHKIADKMGFEVEVVLPEVDLLEEDEEEDHPEDRRLRPPIVTIMGHVDHGKTSLLDAIRQTNTTGSEHGGITQHIGAYQARIKNKWITFLDTPGHEAFTSMRARGAQVTDVVVLVVAADDGIKPQTKEAIDHARAANVPILVAINKIDKPNAKPDEVKKQLADFGLLPEDWGGQTIFSEVSALKKIGIENLLEMLLLQSEILELKANPKLLARGVVIESKLDKGRGPIATVLVQKGILMVGQPFIAGCFFGRIRALVNHQGKKITDAGPSVPVEILGIPDVPQPGDPFMVVKDEKKARSLSALRIQKQRESILAQGRRVTLEDLHQQIVEGQIKELNLIIKADVQGSIQAVQEAFSKLENQEVRIKVIHDAVGGITESDVLLASASNALIIGFNVRPTDKASPVAAREKVDIRLYSVIYDAINDMKQAINGMLAPKLKERIVGRAEVRKIFTIPKMGAIAGCYVLSGNIERNLSARLIRDDMVVYQGKINSLRRFKDDVKSVPSGYECGIVFEKYQDLKNGDIVEPFIMEEVSS